MFAAAALTVAVFDIFDVVAMLVDEGLERFAFGVFFVFVVLIAVPFCLLHGFLFVILLPGL